MKTLLEFLFSPGRTLEQLNPAADPNVQSPLLNHRARRRHLPPRCHGARVHARQPRSGRTSPATCSPAGTPRASTSTRRSRRGAADIISNQMVSFSFAPSIGDFEDDPETAKPLLLSLAYVPALLPAEGLFVAFGGHLEEEIEVGERWTFSAKVRSDAGVAALLGNPPRLRGPFDDANFAASVGFASRPDEVTVAQLLDPAPDRHPARHRPARRVDVARQRRRRRARVDERRRVRHRRLTTTTASSASCSAARRCACRSASRSATPAAAG